MPLSEFKKKLTGAISSRYRRDSDKVPAAEAIKLLQAAESYRAGYPCIAKEVGVVGSADSSSTAFGPLAKWRAAALRSARGWSADRNYSGRVFRVLTHSRLSQSF